MRRQIRIEYPGPIYHLMSRGARRESIMWDTDLKRWLDTVEYGKVEERVEPALSIARKTILRSAPFCGLNEVWNNQERMKGRMLTGQVLSSNYGGWAFNKYWDVPDSNAEPDLVRRRFPDETNTITDAQLRMTPFFSSGPVELYGTHGNNYASPQLHRNTLLAEMIPALSFAAGSNRLESRGDGGNFDMMTLKNGWPQERLSQTNPNWLHSDFKTVAYVYMHPVLLKMIELAELSQ